MARMRRFRGVRQEVRHHLVPFRADGGGHRTRFVDEMVDRGHVDALAELVLVAEEGREVVPDVPVHVDDGLPV